MANIICETVTDLAYTIDWVMSIIILVGIFLFGYLFGLKIEKLKRCNKHG